MIAANVRVFATNADNQISFSLDDSRKLRALEKSDPKLKNIRFRFHRPNSQLLYDRSRLDGVWRSVIIKMNGDIINGADMVVLFHKNELLMCSAGAPFVGDVQVREGVIEFVKEAKNAGDKMKPNSTYTYRFLESGRLELLEPQQSLLIRLEKVETPESEDEKLVFDILAKATETPDYFQAFVVEPAKASDPESLPVPGTKDFVKRVGKPVINRNHILTAGVFDQSIGKRKSSGLAIRLTPEGSARMEQATKHNLRKQMALMIGGEVKIAPTIHSTITESLELSGNFTKKELEEIASDLCVKLDVPKYPPSPVAKSAERIPSPEEKIDNPSEAKIAKLVEAMQHYELKHQAFPMSQFDDGKMPHYSWRVALLPYLGHQDLFDQYNFKEPWDSAANKKVLNQMPDVFKHPSSPNDCATTGYLGITGQRGALGYMKQPKGLADYTDGSSNTICIIEIESEIPWTKPHDFVIDKFEWESQAQFEERFLKIPFFDQDFISVGCADGSTYLLDKEKLHGDVRRATDGAPGWMNLFTIADGNPVDIGDYLYLQRPKAPAK